MINTRILLITALSAVSLGGCASQSQLDEQTKQLAEINTSLIRIQANQAALLEVQKAQLANQVESRNAQLMQLQQLQKR